MRPTLDAIRTYDLTKRFRTTAALDRLNLAVPEGTVYGLLGPNGAGKTTTLRLLAGLIHPTGGTAKVQGYDAVRSRLEVQRRIGYLPGEVQLYADLTGEQNLRFFGRLSPRSSARSGELQQRFELTSAILKRKVRTYSRGMLQKLGIVVAFQHDPLVYLLDEPTAGLDPIMRTALTDLFESERRRGKTILLSSHGLSEVERTCDRVAMIRSGRIVFEGSLDEARDNAPRRLEVVFSGPVAIEWKELPGVLDIAGTSIRHVVAFRGTPGPLLQMLAGKPIEDLAISSPSLEDTFMALFHQPET